MENVNKNVIHRYSHLSDNQIEERPKRKRETKRNESKWNEIEEGKEPAASEAKWKSCTNIRGKPQRKGINNFDFVIYSRNDKIGYVSIGIQLGPVQKLIFCTYSVRMNGKHNTILIFIWFRFFDISAYGSCAFVVKALLCFHPLASSAPSTNCFNTNCTDIQEHRMPCTLSRLQNSIPKSFSVSHSFKN